MATYWTDGGTKNNGQAFQQSVICGTTKKKTLFFLPVGNKTNNEAELLAILEILVTSRAKHVQIYSDSMLAVNLIKGIWKTKVSRLLYILADIKNQRKKYIHFDINWIPREQNRAGWIIEKTLGL